MSRALNRALEMNASKVEGDISPRRDVYVARPALTIAKHQVMVGTGVQAVSRLEGTCVG